jgi:cytochrome c553
MPPSTNNIAIVLRSDEMKFTYWPLLLALTLVVGCESSQPPATPSAEPSDQQLEQPSSATKAELPASRVHVGDVEIGRELAQMCAKCHGLDGVSARSGAPFIAGVEQDYLVRSMIAYTNGARRHPEMERITKSLGPDELSNISAYYASLDTEWKGAIAGTESKSILTDKKALEEGTRIANSCNGCHGEKGRSQKHVNTPSLAGMPLEYFEPALNSYFNGERDHKLMAMFKEMLLGKDAKIRGIAAHYAVQKPERPPKPTIGNANRGKTLAEACAGCHGYDGNSLNPYMPSLAGTPAEYLIKAITDYRDGKRNEELMIEPVANLRDRDIADIAAYYALQITESPLHKNIDTSDAFNPLKDGERMAASCNGCHGNNGNSRMKNIPSLTGQDVKYLARATKGYQTNQRKHKAMHNLVSGLSDVDIEKIAYFYAIQEPAKEDKTRLQGDIAKGNELAAACTMCHGNQGVSGDPANTPSLAGQDANYIVHATQAYSNGNRENDSMANVLENISEQGLIDIASYFEAQSAQKPATYLPDNPAMLVEQRCSRCHGDRGYSTEPGVPRLAGQLEPYIVMAMQEYQQGLRKDSKMTAMSDVLSLIEIKAIAAYYAKQ